jgi:hypothetical protein
MPAQHQPTDDLRRQVRSLAALGVPHREIAPFIGISPPTLRKHYPEELQRGKWEANAKVAQSLFQQATSGHVTACIFWLKSQARWTETSPADEAPDGGLTINFVEAPARETTPKESEN